MILKPTKTGDPKVDKALGEIRDELKKAQGSHLYLFGANSTDTTATIRYLFPGYQSAVAASTERPQVALHDGFLRNLMVRIRDGGDTAGTVTFGVLVNGKDTPLVVSMEQRAFGTFKAKTNTEVPVKAGDTVGISIRKSAAPGVAQAAITANLELVY